MKSCASIMLLLLLPLLLMSQTTTTTPPAATTTIAAPATDTALFPLQWAGAGLLWNNGIGANGLLAYAHRLTSNSMPTYYFNVFRITGWEGNPFIQGSTFKLMTTQEPGVAQFLRTFGRAQIYTFATYGMSQAPNPTNTGLDIGNAYTIGGFAAVSIGRGWSVNPLLSWNKSSLMPTNQWSAGCLFGWGK